jgi:hypothetical protein
MRMGAGALPYLGAFGTIASLHRGTHVSTDSRGRNGFIVSAGRVTNCEMKRSKTTFSLSSSARPRVANKSRMTYLMTRFVAYTHISRPFT